MSLIKEFERTGNFLFKYRSYIPILLYVAVVPVIWLEKNEWLPFENSLWALLCFLVSILGLLVRVFTVGFTPAKTSGRNTKSGQVADVINTTGMYSIVRHPLYVGNFLMWLGIILYVGSTEFLLFSVFFFWFYYERIMFAEEMFIGKKFGEKFTEWASSVPAVFPKSLRWESTALHFSLKNVIRREYHGLFAMVISFAFVNLLKHILQNNQFYLSPLWQIMLLFAAVFYIFVRIIVKKTAYLRVSGR